ncbi:hypothetical protein BDV59DRAFT_196324 [Aspergillus ambiguus]|uniref:uncharacterized protein n=1 Tax=Aspergillus ambiguus TaxID=176160 RepID=UPI003CCDED6A
MSPDGMAWEQAEETSDNWLVQFLKLDILRRIANFILKHGRGIGTEFAILRKGSYGISLRLKYRNGATVIRLSQPDAILFRKRRHQCLFLSFLHSGTKQEISLGLSPFIMMDNIEHETKIYDMAKVLLRLSTPSLPRIGSLRQIDDFTWKFKYAAPTEFSLAPPWWLLLEKPEYWSNGIEDWKTVFSYRRKLRTMKNCEDAAIQEGRMGADQRLSGPMHESWESGDFWVLNAALCSFAFDSPEGAWKERLSLLDKDVMDEMELLVAKKLGEMNTRVLAWDPDEYIVAFRQQLMRQEKRANEESGVKMDGLGENGHED